MITGTSTGIGRACALRLDRAGFDVFAGVRLADDGQRLRADASNRLRPLILDVTHHAGIAAAAKEVREAVGERGLAGLVNNAGVGVGGPLEFMAADEVRRQLEVNLVGQIAVTQAFLPEIRKARGRIVNISSIGGLVANAFFGPYQASKFAMEAVTDVLRKELRPWRIHVVAIEPGTIDTEIWRKSAEAGREILASLPPEGRELYGERIEKIIGATEKFTRRATPPDRVAGVVERALTASRPRTRYLVGSDAKTLARVARILPDRAVDAIQARFLGI